MVLDVARCFRRVSGTVFGLKPIGSGAIFRSKNREIKSGSGCIGSGPGDSREDLASGAGETRRDNFSDYVLTQGRRGTIVGSESFRWRLGGMVGMVGDRRRLLHPVIGLQSPYRSQIDRLSSMTLPAHNATGSNESNASAAMHKPLDSRQDSRASRISSRTLACMVEKQVCATHALPVARSRTPSVLGTKSLPIEPLAKVK
ncbi:hypothetical protein DFH09DRAFT_1085843 [Mycena vulgaris]|nr:hypothetical protein DFH09DRAFT_1085843 [Mycena vulgaris]